MHLCPYVILCKTDINTGVKIVSNRASVRRCPEWVNHGTFGLPQLTPGERSVKDRLETLIADYRANPSEKNKEALEQLLGCADNRKSLTSSPQDVSPLTLSQELHAYLQEAGLLPPSDEQAAGITPSLR